MERVFPNASPCRVEDRVAADHASHKFVDRVFPKGALARVGACEHSWAASSDPRCFAVYVARRKLAVIRLDDSDLH